MAPWAAESTTRHAITALHLIAYPLGARRHSLLFHRESAPSIDAFRRLVACHIRGNTLGVCGNVRGLGMGETA
eukprot:5776470-Prymnesium_polylepis.1